MYHSTSAHLIFVYHKRELRYRWRLRMRERNRNEVALHNKMCDMVIVKEKKV